MSEALVEFGVSHGTVHFSPIYIFCLQVAGGTELWIPYNITS